MRRLSGVALLCAACATLTTANPIGAQQRRHHSTGPVAPRLTAHAAIVVEESTGAVLYGLRAGQELPIASTTKLMTALVTLEHARLTDVYVEPDYHPPPVAAQIGLVPGERMTVHDLLLALLLPSAADAAQDLAYNVGQGSVPRFIAMMNDRAQQLGLAHTHYATPIGFDTPGNYSSAADLVKLAAYLLTHYPWFAQTVAERSAVLYSGDHVRYIVNRNDLLGRWGVNGVKTGSTPAAGDVLVASATRGGMTLLTAVLGTPSQSSCDANTIALLRYGFGNYRLATLLTKGQVLAWPIVIGDRRRRTRLIARSTFTTVLARSASVQLDVEAPARIREPRRRHAIVGRVFVLVNGSRVARVALELAHRLR